MLKKILVTGGAGFIGSHTVNLLLQEGKEVVVIDNLSSGKRENLNLLHPHLTFIEGDILDFTLIKDVLEKCDGIIHLAAIASVYQSLKKPLHSFKVNLQGFLQVLEALHEIGKTIPLVYASSAAVYGKVDELPCRDDGALTGTPLSPYALEKRTMEAYADLYYRLYGIKSVGLRYFNVYGPNQDPHSPYSGVISRFLEHYKKGEVLTIFGDGNQSRDFIFIDEVVKANLLALEKGWHGVLNIATGTPKTLLQLIEYLEVQEHKARLEFKPEREGDIKISYGATSLAEKHLGFKATITLKEGIGSLKAKLTS